MPRRYILAPANPSLEPPMPRRNFLSRLFTFAAGGAVLAPATRALAAPSATSAYEPFIGEIAIVAFTFAPNGWALCNGQLLSIAQNSALFSLLGTFYGGNGTTTFALPNLQGRVPMHTGTRPGGGTLSLGQSGGAETHVLTTDQIPVHTHAMFGDAANGTSDSPTGLHAARNAAGIPGYGAGVGAPMAANAISATGAGQAHNTMPPFLALNFIIATQGIFPSRP
jgi:microcystin-dependent protein